MEIAVNCLIILIKLGADANNLFVVFKYHFVHGFGLLPNFKNNISFAVKKTKAFKVQDVVAKNLGALDLASFSHHVFFHLNFAVLFCSI